jgi:hypothetical protein
MSENKKPLLDQDFELLGVVGKPLFGECEPSEQDKNRKWSHAFDIECTHALMGERRHESWDPLDFGNKEYRPEEVRMMPFENDGAWKDLTPRKPDDFLARQFQDIYIGKPISVDSIPTVGDLIIASGNMEVPNLKSSIENYLWVKMRERESAFECTKVLATKPRDLTAIRNSTEAQLFEQVELLSNKFISLEITTPWFKSLVVEIQQEGKKFEEAVNASDINLSLELIEVLLNVAYARVWYKHTLNDQKGQLSKIKRKYHFDKLRSLVTTLVEVRINTYADKELLIGYSDILRAARLNCLYLQLLDRGSKILEPHTTPMNQTQPSSSKGNKMQITNAQYDAIASMSGAPTSQPKDDLSKYIVTTSNPKLQEIVNRRKEAAELVELELAADALIELEKCANQNTEEVVRSLRAHRQAITALENSLSRQITAKFLAATKNDTLTMLHLNSRESRLITEAQKQWCEAQLKENEEAAKAWFKTKDIKPALENKAVPAKKTSNRKSA